MTSSIRQSVPIQLEFDLPSGPELKTSADHPPIRAARPKHSTAVGWHGMRVASIEVDWRLIGELTPEGQAVKVVVAARSPASRAGLRTGDYIVSVSPSPTDEMSLADFDARGLPPGSDAYVKFHRPAKGTRREIEIAAIRLRKLPPSPKTPPWQRTPRIAFGPKVMRDERSKFEAQMATHPRMSSLGFRILVRMIRYYDGPLGLCPSYARLARDVGCKRRAAINQINRLGWLGVVDIVKKAGLRGKGGTTNQFTIHWPEGWGDNVVKLKTPR
jgi:hypothetical protein